RGADMAVAVNSFLAEAERAGILRRGTDPAWLTRTRLDALERFDRLGFPTTHDEDWRFTSVAPIAEARFVLARDGASSVTADDVGSFRSPGESAATLVFVNGRFAEHASDIGHLPTGVRVESLARALRRPSDEVDSNLTHVAHAEHHAFTALNTAFLGDGAFVFVPSGTAVGAPIHLLFLSSPEGTATMPHPRVLIVAGANSQATVVESYRGLRAERYFTNAVTEIAAGQNSTVEHYRVQRESPASYHVGAMYLHA